MGYADRLRRARATVKGAGDIMPHEFVQLITGTGRGIVASIDGNHATVIDLWRPGHREILPVNILMKAEAPDEPTRVKP